MRTFTAYVQKRKINGRWLYLADPQLSASHWTTDKNKALYFSRREIEPKAERLYGERYEKA